MTGCRLHWASPRRHEQGAFTDVKELLLEVNSRFRDYVVGDGGWAPLTDLDGQSILVNPDWVASVTPIPDEAVSA